MPTLPWSLETYCKETQASSWSLDSIPASSREFIQSLPVTLVHPFCTQFVHNNNSNNQEESFYHPPGVPPQGPLIYDPILDRTTLLETVIAWIAQTVPSLMAILELWLRLFAGILGPLGVAHLLWLYLTMTTRPPSHTTRTGGKEAKTKENIKGISTQRGSDWVYIVTLASCWIVWTDELYVSEFGSHAGRILTAAAVFLCSGRKSTKVTVAMAVVLVLSALHLFGNGSSLLEEQRPSKSLAGLHHDDRVGDIVQAWKKNPKTAFSFDYDSKLATRWMPTGDSRTGLPFLMNSVPAPAWHRVWLSVKAKDDNTRNDTTAVEAEVVALDIAFPPQGHRTDRPVYLVLHGLNGGSQEEYVRDLTGRLTSDHGSTVVVMIARGLMDLPVRGWNLFHGARWTDADQAATALRQGLAKGQLLAGVGYSMGAIIMSNWLGRAGPDCALDMAVAISGGLDMRFETNFTRAQRLWQPILASELRETFVVGKWGERVRKRLTRNELKALLHATHISEIDATAVVAYHGFTDLDHYYSEMSLLGDIPIDTYANGTIDTSRRVHHIAVPLLVMHSLDDPLVTWRTTSANTGNMHPKQLVTTGQGNLILFLTARGGHVGWPMGWLPFHHRWQYMSEAAISFVSAVAQTRPESRWEVA